MNTTGCPDGWATDVIMFYNNEELACDMPVAVWIVFFVVFCGLKLFVAITHTKLWVTREHKRENNRSTAGRGRSARSRRFPIVPAMSWMLFMIYLAFFLVSTLNVARGVPAFIFGLGWMLFGLIYLAYAFKFINLGHRIGARSTDISKSERDKLSKIDVIGKIIVVIGFVSLIGQTICYCVLGLIYPSDYMFIQIANGFDGWFVASATTILLYQMQRVKNAIYSSRDANKANLTSPAGRELELVLNKLNKQQLSAIVIATVSVVFYMLVAVGVLLCRYYIFTLFMWAEIAAFMFIIATNRKRKETAVADNNTNSSDKADLEKHASMSHSNSNSAPTIPASKASSMIVHMTISDEPQSSVAQSS
jgi:hypothetical protein